jgi:pteridine reductase
MKAFITGGATRLGRVIAETLAENNIELIIQHTSGSRAHARQLQKTLSTKVAITLCECDFSDSSELDSVLGDLRDCDILINNASSYSPSDVSTIEPAELCAALQVNAFSPLRLSQLFSRQKKTGSIINILDRNIYSAPPGYAGYILSKHMLAKITELLAVELAPYIRVNAIAPGMVLPQKSDPRTYTPAATKNNLLKRLGEPAHIASTVLFLIHNDFITGEIIFVDGGERLQKTSYTGH